MKQALDVANLSKPGSKDFSLSPLGLEGEGFLGESIESNHNLLGKQRTP